MNKLFLTAFLLCVSGVSAATVFPEVKQDRRSPAAKAAPEQEVMSGDASLPVRCASCTEVPCCVSPECCAAFICGKCRKAHNSLREGAPRLAPLTSVDEDCSIGCQCCKQKTTDCCWVIALSCHHCIDYCPSCLTKMHLRHCDRRSA